MTIASYCKSKGMNLEQYKNYEQNIVNAAQAIITLIKQNYKIDTGVYYPVNDILTFSSDPITKSFIIQALKQLGVEFYDNNTLWRY